MVKMAVKNINLVQPTAAAQYFFEDYYRQLTAPLLINPAERGTRQRPTTGQDVITNRLDALEDRKAKHQAFFGKLSEKANYYWFDHPYWQRQPRNVLRLQNMGHFLNIVNDCLEVPRGDPVRPSHKRCSVCHELVSLREKNHGCDGATLTVIPLLMDTFKRVSDVVPSALAGLVDIPDQINSDSIEHLKSVVRATRSDAPKTLQGWIKHIVLNDSQSLEPGMLQLLIVGISVACSEGIAETYGSVMERYHRSRFLNTGTANDDVRLQKEMFLMLNGPPLGRSKSLCRRMSSRLNAGPTNSYQRLHPYQRQYKLGKVVQRLQEEKSYAGFFAKL